jgi:hypothetical protein
VGAGAALSREALAGAAGARGGRGAAPSREAGAGATGTRGGPGAAPSREAGTGAVGTRGGPGVAPSREAGTEASGHVGTHARLVLCLNLELVRGGTRSSGYRQWPPAHPGRGCEPAGGANILFPSILSESCTLGFRSGGAARLIRGNPRFAWDVAMFGVEPSRAAVPRGSLLLSGSLGARGNHDHDPRTGGTPRIRDARGFRFSAAAPSFRRPVPTDERDLGPLVSAWVCGAHGVGMKRCTQWAAACRGG